VVDLIESGPYSTTAVVDIVSFTIETGTLVTLLGPSGCGKSTTLRLIAGLEHPTSGRIEIGGREVTGLSAAERDVSMVFQSYTLFPHMTVLGNATYRLRASGLGRAAAARLARQKLALVGLAGLEERPPSELSGGQQERVAVAQAIVLEPKVLLFDEPLSNLDAKLRRHVREEVRALQQELGLTVVYASHEQTEALAASDRIVVTDAGRIAQDGTPRQLYEHPGSRFIAGFIGDANLVPATLRRANGGAELTVGELRLAVPDPGVPEGAMLLAVRPHAVRLGGAGVAARVAKAAYLGSHMKYELELPRLAEPLFVVSLDVAVPLAAGGRHHGHPGCLRDRGGTGGVELLPFISLHRNRFNPSS
jgi:iron(III) transport system ATP-binding protein